MSSSPFTVEVKVEVEVKVKVKVDIGDAQPQSNAIRNIPHPPAVQHTCHARML